jgi:dethiobiotin synthetase
MSSGFFITGTDTDVGKTWVTLALMRALQMQGLVVNGMKPVAAGCQWMQGGWKNADALLLQQYASRALDYHHINPYAFQSPVSPHIACGDSEVKLDVILQGFRFLTARSDCVLVEGAGGWFSPLCREWDNAHLAKIMQLPVILVVGMRLGCINHARLTNQAIRQSGCELAGWVAVRIDRDMPEFQANQDFLQAGIDAPLLGVLPYMPRPDFAYLASRLKIQN